MRKSLSLVAVVTAAAALVVTPGTSSAAPVRQVKWVACPADVALGDLECGTLQVPLDYREPHGRQTEVMISKLASKNPEKRKGVLLTNPGGPAEGLTFPFLLKALGLPQSVLDAYDVIGMDPRGIGFSSPSTCDMTEEQMADGSIPPYANNSAEVRQRADEVKKIAEQCLRSSSADELPYNTTANIARDLDSVRAALGEKKASYLGYSYGSYLGSVYATLFPKTSDRVVIDSNLPKGGWDVEGGRLMGRGVEDTFPDFAKWAAAHPEYNLGTTPQQVRAKFFDLAARLDEKPSVEGIDGRVFRLSTFTSLYATGDAAFSALAASWKAYDTGQPQPPVEYPEVPRVQALLAGRLNVMCGDSAWPSSVRTYERNVEIDRLRHPMFGAAAANIQPCAFWPKPVEKQVLPSDRGPRNVLLVQNERDPATPLAAARSTRRAFGDRAAMITIDQGGHGAYVIGKNKCANDEVTEYLLGGQRPNDTKCAAETS
ncbi:alpha/beta hydrolase [Lentzea cavernae]|uniref:Alpha/beta hydrolase n=1 Tax=Lentzea cavernae TaxID=2020703 RepID=A0ABQ3MEG3_9PSEU|nr:alpha/beta hydrolase [Lentzea cavernae]GHH38744.1 alpha/beta hydrolase [Lentzea cavernae]